MNFLDTIKLPDEVGYFIFKVYGQKGYYPCFKPGPPYTWTNGIVMLRDVSKMDQYDYEDFKKEFKRTPYISGETSKWLIDRGYDVFGFIKKGWIANMSIYDEQGFDKAMKEKDRMQLQYDRIQRKEEEKLGRKEESKGSLLERRSWVTFTDIEDIPVDSPTTYKTHYGWCVYEHNSIGKLTRRQEISEDGELLYEGNFYYRKHKENYYLYKYTNSNGTVVNYDTIKNERWKNKGNFR